MGEKLHHHIIAAIHLGAQRIFHDLQAGLSEFFDKVDDWWLKIILERGKGKFNRDIHGFRVQGSVQGSNLGLNLLTPKT